MTASLNIAFANPSDATQPGAPGVVAVLQQAFAAWAGTFDYTTGSYTLTVRSDSKTTPVDFDLSRGDVALTAVAPPSYDTIVESSFGLALTGRAYDTTRNPSPTFYINPAYLNGSLPTAPLLGPAERYFEQALGVISYGLQLRGEPFAFPLTVYETHVRTPIGPGGLQTVYAGPNAEAVYGGTVPLVTNRDYVNAAPSGTSVDSSVQTATSLQPLDVALLRDAGLPALTAQELGEHEIARLYVAALGRDADSAGLIASYQAYKAGESLVQIANGLVGSAEFAARFGTEDFAQALYQNAFGRAPSAAEAQFVDTALQSGAGEGSLAAAFADSDEARGRLAASPNVAYAGTAEEQVARLYDTVFGRAPDPAGFDDFTQAIISGETLGQAAKTFMASQEFTNLYGSAPSNAMLVTELYQNTLHRAPDAAGLALYVNALNSGQLGRADLLVSFSESAEHVNLLAQTVGARNAAGYNLDINPPLGLIPVISGPTSSSV